MRANAFAQGTPRELAHRQNDGVEVVLLWHDTTNAVTVCVSDARSGAYFELAVAPDRALDVFYHPYSYAALNGVSYEDHRLAA